MPILTQNLQQHASTSKADPARQSNKDKSRITGEHRKMIEKLTKRKAKRNPSLGGSCSARDTVRGLLSAVSPYGPIVNPVSAEEKSAGIISKALSALYEAREEKILTVEETDALTQFLISQYIEKEIDKNFMRVFLPTSKRWFFLASSEQSTSSFD